MTNKTHTLKSEQNWIFIINNNLKYYKNIIEVTLHDILAT
jgi:hypothetical protein